MAQFISLAARSALLLFIATALLPASPVHAQQTDDATQLVSRLIADETTEDQEVAELAMQIAMLGQPGVDVLSKALETAKNDTAILRLTYALGNASSSMGRPAGLPGGEVRLPDAAIDRLIDLAKNPPHPLIQTNAMFALASTGPRALEAVPAIIERLGEEEDESVRAGIQYWLAERGEPAIPMLVETLLSTDNERLQGDIALTLQGQALPEDVIAFLIDALAKATRDDTREQITRVLTRMKPVPQAARTAFITALAGAKNDRMLMSMAFALDEVKGDTSEAARAFADAAKKTEGSSERMQIIRLMLQQGTDGAEQWARLAKEASNDAFRSDLLRTNPAIYARDTPKENTITGLIVIIQATANEEIKKDAIFALAGLGNDARQSLEQHRSQTADMRLKESLSAALAIIASQDKKTP
jgi:hypothetical protein